MSFHRADLIEATLDLAIASAAVSNFCDHVEHNEPADLSDVRNAAAILRSTAVRLALKVGEDPVRLYADRLAMIEARNVLRCEELPDGYEAARETVDWRSLQLIQAAHDRAYHADVVGLTKSDQLRHYALHLSKLAGATARVARREVPHEDWLRRRVADMLLFGLKLSTVTSECLPETTVETSSAPHTLEAAV